ncbi:MAG: hypothetical protein LBO72_02670 [Helicobacteraceae bacterium]|nr:hypothetical protein [Helicobacteraceae bacterium]
MKYETLKTLDQNESDFALGKSYAELAAKGLNAQTPALIAALNAHLLRGENDAKKAAFYDFLIELVALTFLLYKWGLLLFHLEQNALDNMILTILVDGERAIIVENEGKLTLEKLQDGKALFSAEHNQKSALCSVLLWIMKKQSAIEIVSVSEDAQRFDGNRVSFNADRKAAQADRIALIKTEFFRHKKRLDGLQKLFVDSFGYPQGMSA